MLIALCVVAAVVVLLGLHLVVLPIAKKRPVLLRGAEPTAALALLILFFVLLVPFLWTFFVLQGLAAVMWRPWIVVGVTRDELTGAVEKAAGMVRLRIERADATYTLSKIGTATVTSVGRVHLIGFRVRRTPKLVLFQNVLRKTIQNYSLGSAGAL